MVDFRHLQALSINLFTSTKEIEKNIDEIQKIHKTIIFYILETVQISKYTIGSVIIMAEDYR